MFERSSFSSGQNEDASLPLSPEVSAVQTVSNKSTSIQARDLIPLYYATTRVSFSWQSSINNRGILKDGKNRIRQGEKEAQTGNWIQTPTNHGRVRRTKSGRDRHPEARTLIGFYTRYSLVSLQGSWPSRDLVRPVCGCS